MPQRFWSGTIDGIPLLDLDGEVAGFELKGAQAFTSGEYVKAITKAADGYPHEVLSPALYGQELELAFLHIPASLLTALINALTARNDAGESFPCVFQDGWQTITRNFKTGASPFFDRGSPDGDYVNDAVLRIISTGV